MGRLLQLLCESRREDILRMLNLLIIIAVTAGVQGDPEGGYFAYGHHQDHCHTQVHHTAALVGHHTEQHREKREARAVQGYYDEPQCHARTDRQCHQKPVQTSHQVPRQVCVPVHRQVCVPHEVRTPYQVCGHSHVQVEQY